MAEFDFRSPDYDSVWEARMNRLRFIRSRPEVIPGLKAFYKESPADFVNDWGVTFDPRNVERGLPPLVPFVLFPRQRDWLDFVFRKWKAREPGLSEKSRDSGLSWLSIGMGCTLCLFYDGMVIGYGSRKAEYVDKIGEPKSLFFKARLFMQELPAEFKGGWDATRHAPYMRIVFPGSGSTITGESGDNIGRGDRCGIYFVDESAFLERPHRVEMSLSQTTNCRMDISTPNGIGNPFEQKRHAGKIEVFTFHWRDDPRKDDAWYQKQVADLNDPVVVAQEIDIDYSASVEGVLIPHAWIMAAVDAHKRLGVKPTGAKRGGLDVADEGKDTNAFCGAYGFLIEHLEEWSGKGDDIYGTVHRAFAICDGRGYPGFAYDADGLGAGVRGDARVINEQRRIGKVRQLVVTPFRGSGPVHNPDREDVKGRKNKDFFANCKAQEWWGLRGRFLRTYRWVRENVACSPDEIISIPADLPNFTKLVSELAQPTYSINKVGKILIDKMPDGARSPNLADAVMIRFARAAKAPLVISEEVLARSALRR